MKGEGDKGLVTEKESRKGSRDFCSENLDGITIYSIN
jgi:hypothetical protein